MCGGNQQGKYFFTNENYRKQNCSLLQVLQNSCFVSNRISNSEFECVNFLLTRKVFSELFYFIFHKYTDQHVFFLGHYSLVYCTEIFHKLKAFLDALKPGTEEK